VWRSPARASGPTRLRIYNNVRQNESAVTGHGVQDWLGFVFIMCEFITFMLRSPLSRSGILGCCPQATFPRGSGIQHQCQYTVGNTVGVCSALPLIIAGAYAAAIKVVGGVRSVSPLCLCPVAAAVDDKSGRVS
jgi:hypothetical protein